MVGKDNLSGKSGDQEKKKFSTRKWSEWATLSLRKKGGGGEVGERTGERHSRSFTDKGQDRKGKGKTT